MLQGDSKESFRVITTISGLFFLRIPLPVACYFIFLLLFMLVELALFVIVIVLFVLLYNDLTHTYILSFLLFSERIKPQHQRF